MQITDKALIAGAITLQQSEDLENFIDASLIENVPVDIPEHLKGIFDISMRYLHGNTLH